MTRIQATPGFLGMRFNIAGFTMVLATILFVAIASLRAQPPRRPVLQASVLAVRVIGTLALRPSAAANGNDRTTVDLPDIPVELQDPTTRAVKGKATTLLDGTFAFTGIRPGTYLFCATINAARNCNNRVVVKATDTWARTLLVSVEGPVAFGRVLTADKRPCWVSDHFFNLDVSTRVAAQDGGGAPVGNAVRANTKGDYALFGLPVGAFDIVARCEKAEVVGKAAVRLSVRTDLVLPNHAPRLDAIAARSAAGRAIARAGGGDTIALEASGRDRDGDAIEYLWRTLDGNGTIASSTSFQQKWQLPAAPGLHSVYLMARDNKGGYTYRRFDMRSAETETFSGRVTDETTGLPLSGALATVAGASAKTDAAGWFTLTVKPQREDRYILNIARAGYVPVSRVYGQTQSGVTYDLQRAQVTVLPADKALDLTDSASGGWCGTGRDGNRRPAARPLARPQLIDVADNGERPDPRIAGMVKAMGTRGADRPCDPLGARIVIDSGALVGSDGKAPRGNIVAAMAGLNPARRALPGDYGATGTDGVPTRLFSYGAVYAEFRDAAGGKLNLAPGKTAELHIPVPLEQRGSAKPDIALWTYDDQTGGWVEEGAAKLSPAGDEYVGRTRHFSSINMDIKLTGGTCARFHVPPGSFTGWTNLRLRAFVTFGGTNSQTFETPLNGDDYHAFFRIPFGPATAPNTLRFEVKGSFGTPASDVVLVNNIVNIDAIPAVPTSGAISYPAPYAECGNAIELAPPAGVVPAFAEDATGRPIFLQGPFGGFNPSPADFDPVAGYYKIIDPTDAKTTLGDWWNLNGFGADGLGAGNTSYTQAGYLNDNDLGFGRDMHCAKNNGGAGPGLACYVTNYGLPDQDAGNADLPAAKRGATVTMEYNPAAPAGQNVQFYVYGGGDAAAPRINYADLDGFGPKPVPHLCTVCHGGNYNPGPKVAVNSVFREFDMPSFKYSSSHSWNYGQAVGATTPSAVEFGKFAALNHMVHDVAPPKIAALITAWYPGGYAGNPLPALPTAPAGWTAATYHEPYGKTCRACHIARSFDFTSDADFASTSGAVCGSGRVMPNAIVTYKNFWADTSRVNLYEAATATPLNTCKNN